jgi:CubicO group peptidase (beta-lactamase class C family)
MGDAATAFARRAKDPYMSITALARQMVAARLTPGVQICLSQRGVVLYSHALGSASLELGAPLLPKSIMRAGSITKEFTAAAVLKLAEDERLRLDDTLETHLPGFPNGKLTTLRDILSHTSGLANFTETVPAKAFLQTARTDRTTAELLELLAASSPKLLFPPRTAWRYSNTGYVLLGAVVERVSGTPFSAFLKDRIIGPAGLMRTAVDDAGDVVLLRAAGYSNDAEAPLGFRNAPFTSMTTPGAAGDLRTTAEDVCIWRNALFSGRVLSPQSLKEMTTPATLAGGTLPADFADPAKKRQVAYGLGVFLDALEGRRAIWHGGGIQGFTGMLATLPDVDAAFCTLFNTDDGADMGAAQAAARLALLRAILDILQPL